MKEICQVCGKSVDGTIFCCEDCAKYMEDAEDYEKQKIKEEQEIQDMR